MEAGSLSFGAAKPACPQRYPVQRAQLAQENAPSTRLPMGFFLFALVALAAGAVWLVAEPQAFAEYHYRPHTVAMAHLFILGFILSVVMGATYQMVPVALQTKLFSERLAQWQWGLHAIGAIGMVVSFYIWNLKQVGHFGSLEFVAMLLFVYNIVRTLRHAHQPDVVAKFIALAMLWLFVTMSVGLLIAANKFWPILPESPLALMHAHAHLGVIGIFVMLLAGVSLRLVPMFALSEVQSPVRATVALVLLNVGLVDLIGAIVFQQRVAKFGAALTVSFGLLVYGFEMVKIVKARKRKAIDWGLRYFFTALWLLAPTAICGLILAWPETPLTPLTVQLENLYAFLGIFGVVTLGIVGMLHKIIPFLVWFQSYSPLIGRCKLPAVSEMSSPRVAAWSYFIFLGALPAVAVGTLFQNKDVARIASALIASAVFLFLVNMTLVLRHWVQPRTEALSVGTKGAAA